MEEECKIALNTGLRGITIASTRICEVDGKNGRLIYRGYRIEDLARASYEEVVHLLLHERLPSPAELADFRRALAAERALPDGVIAALKTMPPAAHPMDVLQAAVPMLAGHDPDIKTASREASLRSALRLIAKFPTVVAAWHRIRSGLAPLAPNPELAHAANFIYLLTGKAPAAEGETLMWTSDLAPGASKTVLVKIPYVVLTEKAEQEALAKLDFEQERRAVAGYWRRRLDESARLITPEPMLNEFYRAHAGHLLINCEGDPDSAGRRCLSCTLAVGKPSWRPSLSPWTTRPAML